MRRFAAFMLLVSLSYSACGGVSTAATATQTRSASSLPPTAESSPTANPRPSATPALAATPNFTPTKTALPSPTSTPDSRMVVALTIDDGWIKTAFDTMLDMLAEHNVRATFFLIIRAANQLGPDRMQRLVAEGHEIGYHSFSHGALEELRTWGVADWSDDYDLWVESMRALLGDQAFGQAVRPYARAPYGLFTPTFLAMTEQKGLVPVSWSVDLGGTGAIRLTHGDILMIHVSSSDAQALAEVLLRENIRLGSLSEFLPANLGGSILKTIPLD